MDAQGNRVFAVDFDGTLSLGKWPETGEPNEELFSFLIKEKEKGSRIILYTCRNGEQLSEAVRYCNHYGLKFDEVNRNLQEYIEFYGGDTGDGYLQFLTDYVKEHGMSGRVTFFGEVTNVFEKTRNAYCYVNSSDEEGLSNSMMESMAMGIPVITTDSAGWKYLSGK